jgi:hypothetical protein
MTAQIPDGVVVDGTTWALVGINGQGLFDPAGFGLQPISLSTGEWRGFTCRYAIEAGRLRLAHLSIGRLREEAGTAAIERLPSIARSTQDRARWEFDFEGLEVPFTGTLLLGDEFIRDLYVHMGFHPAWKWGRVLELQLAGGEVTRTADRSAEYAQIREQQRGQPLEPGPKADANAIARWIRGTFDRSIARSRGGNGDGRP